MKIVARIMLNCEVIIEVENFKFFNNFDCENLGDGSEGWENGIEQILIGLKGIFLIIK